MLLYIIIDLLNLNYRVEAESLLHLSAKYCPLLPPPRSTIAAAFSPDGKTLASTQLISPPYICIIRTFVYIANLQCFYALVETIR